MSSEISSGSFPPIGPKPAPAHLTEEVAVVTLWAPKSGTVKGGGALPWGQRLQREGRGLKVKEPGLLVASGFKQLCLEIEENLSGKMGGLWQASQG